MYLHTNCVELSYSAAVLTEKPSAVTIQNMGCYTMYMCA